MFDRELAARIEFEQFISTAPYERDTSIFDDKSAWPECYKDISVHLAFDSWKASRDILLGGEIITESKAAVNSFKSFCSLISTLWALFCEHKYLRVSWSTKKDRTLDQNALWAAMYKRISDTCGDSTAYGAQEVKRYLKLRIGVPILRRDDEEFKALYDRVIRPHDYETKLKVIELVRITSEFNTKQGAEYTDSIVRHYHDNGVSVFFDDLLSN